jgi:transcriptional regulator NrdR family protein
LKDGIRCVSCFGTETEVIDSRPGPGRIRRRRACSRCGFRFSTVEAVVVPKVKLNVRQVRQMRGRDMTYQEIGERLGVSTSTVWNVINA